jgi:hypothetical protein
MTTPTQDQALQRWDTLSDNLREALCLEANTDFISTTCANEHIPEDKVSIVSRVSGYVLMGFLHPEDVAQELKNRLGLDTQTANLIEDALNKRIFVPLRADIDKVYAPISKLETAPTGAPKPKVIQDVNVAQPKPAPTLPAVGWSQMKPPPPSVGPTPARPAPTVSLSGIRPPTPVAATAPRTTAPAAPAEPPPVMLHEDTSFKAAQKNMDFTFPRPGGGSEVRMGATPTTPAPPRPAVLEFGSVAKPTVAPATGPSSSGATHYSDFRPSLSTTPMASAGPRNIAQMIPAAPAPTSVPTPTRGAVPSVPVPKPPVPPQPPRPPQPPQQRGATPPQNNGPIVKDFL